MDTFAFGGAGMAIATGLALAAACGLRTFLPLLAVALLGLLGWMPLSDATPWLATLPAIAVIGALCAIEIAADKVPGLDHTVDGVGFSLKPVVAMLVGVASMHGTDPALAGLLGGVAGGSAATVLGVGKAKLRVLSTQTTGGLGNIALSLAEDVVAVVAIAVAIPAPAAAALGLGAVAAALAAVGSWGRRARWAWVATRGRQSGSRFARTRASTAARPSMAARSNPAKAASSSSLLTRM